MNAVNISSVDLNLLVVLDALLQEGSATRAAARLHVTQSAVSSALRRLRDLFGDPLLVRRAHGLSPTPRAARLAPELSDLLGRTRALLAGEPSTDLAATTRTFSIACSDAVATVLLAPLLREMRVRLPAARLRLVTIDRMVASDGLARGSIDLLVGIPPELPRGCLAELLYEDPMRCIVRAGHPRAKRRLSLASYTELPHVELALFGQPDETVDRALARRGKTREVRVSVPYFASIPMAVVATDAVATLSARVAAAFEREHRLTVLPPPVPLPKLRVNVVWHRRSEGDTGVALMRQLMHEAVVRASRSRSRSR